MTWEHVAMIVMPGIPVAFVIVHWWKYQRNRRSDVDDPNP